jgi:hypothetical protein
VRGRRIAATALDALLLAAPWASLVGLMTLHGAWGGQLGGLGDAFSVIAGCAAADALLLLLQAIVWLAAGRTVGMGLAGIAVAKGRPWLASIEVVAIVVVLGGVSGAVSAAAGSVDPQNAAAAVLVLAKVADLAFLAGPSGRTLVDRMSGSFVALVPPPGRRRVGAGLVVDVSLGLALAAPGLLALTDLGDLAGAAAGTGATLLAFGVVEVLVAATSKATLGMRVLA